MIFAHDTEVALAAVAALVNTLDGDEEQLTDVAALDAFVRDSGWAEPLQVDEGELHAVRKLRGKLRRIWHAGEDEVVEIVNGLLRGANALPQLVKHGEWDYHVHAVPFDAPISTRIAVEAAMAFVDVVRGKELGRLRVCAYPGCENVGVDLSKNRSRRFCEAGCGNRAAVAAYRARKAGQPADAVATAEDSR